MLTALVCLTVLSVALAVWDTLRRYFTWRPAHYKIERKVDEALEKMSADVEDAKDLALKAAKLANQVTGGLVQLRQQRK